MESFSDIAKRMDGYGFFEKMQGLGYKRGPGRLWFYRKRGFFIDTLKFQPLAGGRSLRIHLSTYIPDIVPSYDMDDFPKGFASAGGNIFFLYLTRDGISYGGGNWKIESDNDLKNSLSLILDKVSKEVSPWFDSIDSRKKLYDCIHDNVKLDNEGYTQIYERVLLD